MAVIMLSLNEGHNMEAVLKNLSGWAQEVFLVDSYSSDETIDVALRHGIHVVQRAFTSFSDQWNFALTGLPITAPWTMKIDPDERVSDELKQSIVATMNRGGCDGIAFERRWWLMGRRLTIADQVLRVWRTGSCRFTDVLVNEHPLVQGTIQHVPGILEHLDSPDLDHWVAKQNAYSTSEALVKFQGQALAAKPKLFGNSLQRRMWVKANFSYFPFRFTMLFLYFFIRKGLWKSGWQGYASARLWTFFYFIQDCKYREMRITKRIPRRVRHGPSEPDPRVAQY